MTARKLTVAALLVPLLVAALAALATPASAQVQAQQNSLRIDCAGGAQTIQPLGRPGTWSCTVTITYSSGGQPLSEPVNPAIIEFTAPDRQSWMNVIISPSALAFPYDANAQVTRQLTVTVALTQNAPAFVSSPLTIQPNVVQDPRPPLVTVSPQQTQLTVTPGYFNLYNVRLDQKIIKQGPQETVTYPIILDNFSNGDTRFEFAFTQENLPPGFQASLPEPVTVRSQATGGAQTQGQATFQVITPFRNGYVNDIGSIQLRVDSFYAPDVTIEGASSVVSTITQARGFYVPGFEAPFLILGFAGVALVMGRRNGQRES